MGTLKTIHQNTMATVEENILHSLKKNGYPDKRVSLPFQPVFKACKTDGKSLSDVLEKLEEQGIKSKVEGDRILFLSKEHSEPSKQEPEPEFDLSSKIMQDAMKKMKEMDPKELEKLKQQVTNMSPEEKEQMMKQAKEFFKKSR